MRLIRAPPESSSVSTWSPEPSILFSKSTPNCWTILWEKRKSECQSRGTDTALELCPKSSHGLLSSFYFFGNKMYVWVKKTDKIQALSRASTRYMPGPFHRLTMIIHSLNWGREGQLSLPFAKEWGVGEVGITAQQPLLWGLAWSSRTVIYKWSTSTPLGWLPPVPTTSQSVWGRPYHWWAMRPWTGGFAL